jgi:hypothetical protein
MRHLLIFLSAAAAMLFSATDIHAGTHSIGVVEPYRETHDSKQAAFSVTVCVNYAGRAIRNSTQFFSINSEPGFIIRGSAGTGDGSDGKWATQSLNISTRHEGIYVRFSDSAGQGGVKHRDLQKKIHLPWTRTEYEEVDGLYTMTVAVNWINQ